MKTHFIFRIALLAMIAIASCCPCKRVAVSNSSKQKEVDSTYTEVVNKSKTSTTPTAAVSATRAIPSTTPCPEVNNNVVPFYGSKEQFKALPKKKALPNKSADQSTQTKKSGNATLTTGVKDGAFFATCFCDSLTIRQDWQERHTRTFKQKLTEVLKSDTIVKYIIPKWIIAVTVIQFLIIIILLLILKFR